MAYVKAKQTRTNGCDNWLLSHGHQWICRSFTVWGVRSGRHGHALAQQCHYDAFCVKLAHAGFGMHGMTADKLNAEIALVRKTNQ
eukprot:5328548-Amphidinium_carterae.1